MQDLQLRKNKLTVEETILKPHSNKRFMFRWITNNKSILQEHLKIVFNKSDIDLSSF